MSPDDLSEDLRQWPESPYELLGVSMGANPRDIRRAYTRLIRRFKPEQYPEHFRRVRDAYELILQQVKFWGFMQHVQDDTEDETPPDSNDEVSPDVDVATDADEESAPSTQSVPPRNRRATPANSALDKEPFAPAPRPGPNLDEELKQLWEQVCSGQEQAAYYRLQQLHEQYPDRADICARLYWIQTLSPEVDSTAKPCRWLISGLRAGGLQGPLRELYRRELLDRPADNLDDFFDKFQRESRPALLQDFALWRWQAAARLDRWEVIQQDLDALRDWVVAEDDETWARMLIQAVYQLAWAASERPRELMGRCLEDLERCTHLHIRLAEELHQLDRLLEVAADWQSLEQWPNVSSKLTALIKTFWSGSYGEWQPLLSAYSQEIVADPHGHLAIFEGIRRQHSVVFMELVRLLLEQQHGREEYSQDTRSQDDIAPFVFEFLDDFDLWSSGQFYRSLRPKILSFCLAEAISPDTIAQVIDDRGRTHEYIVGSEYLSNSLRADWSLRCIYLAQLQFWS